MRAKSEPGKEYVTTPKMRRLTAKTVSQDMTVKIRERLLVNLLVIRNLMKTLFRAQKAGANKAKIYHSICVSASLNQYTPFDLIRARMFLMAYK